MERQDRLFEYRACKGGQDMSMYPKFAVVGHPNKGKSSIVSTLSMDSSVAISDIPGTTTKYRAYPLKVDGEIIYELYDTPGFQRPRAVLDWLRQKELPANLRRERVIEFVNENENNPKFADDIELLKPILAGAGIIYVVDGSKPYGKEFEAEMEILRECAAPSMAVINMIGDRDFSNDWKNALSHYFRSIRRFNPMKANFSQIISMLESMAQLEEDWTEALKRAIEALKDRRKNDISKSARIITDMIKDIMSHRVYIPVREQGITPEEIDKSKIKYLNDLAEIENRALRKIANIFNRGIEIDTPSDIFSGIELFSKESISLFGLDKKTVLLLSASGGAMVGSSIDAVVGGSSMLMGTLIGATTGLYGAWRGFDKLMADKIIGKISADKKLVLGPVKDMELPFVFLKRGLYFTVEIANRPHANREDIDIAQALKSMVDIDFAQKRKLQKFHHKFAKDEKISYSLINDYSNIIESYLTNQIDR